MSLQERTLVIKNFDPERTTSMLLKELCIQGGPVRNVVVKPDHAFVEYEDMDSVGYSKALLDGVELFGQRLVLEPKIRYPGCQKFNKMLEDYIRFHKQQERKAQLQRQQQEVMNAAYHNYNYQQSSMQPPPQPQPQLIGHHPNPQPYLNPSLQMPNYFTPLSEPVSFNYDPHIQQNQYFMVPDNHQMPSTSAQGYNNNGGNNLQRSRSFDHNQSQRHGSHNRDSSNGHGNRNRRRR